jgi:hypothetical protein
VKCFSNEQLFLSIADSTAGSKLRFNCLNKIQLNFTLKACFRFFGVEVDPTISIDKDKCMACICQKMSRDAFLKPA